GYLNRRGYPTTVSELTGGRAALVDALANGDVDLAVEYSASLLEYLNGFAGEAGTDADATSARLAEYLDLIGVAAVAPAPATSTNVFMTTKEVAEQRGLSSLSDLAGTGLPVAVTEAATTAPGPRAEPELGIMVRAVGHQLASGSAGPEVRDVQERLSRLGFATEVNGTYDGGTIDAVRGFQASQGLATDGVVGPETAAALASPATTVDDPQPVRPGDGEAVDPPRAPTKAPGGAAGGKVLYLTFDDGPAVTYTRQILDLLDRYDAKATFFQLGQNASAHPDLTREVIRRGHAVGSHTWDHADMRRLSRTALDHEITTTSTTLEKLTGRPITCLRPPYGALNGQARAAVKRAGLDLQLWNIDPQDWNRPGVSAIVRDVVGNARAGRVSLMHDGGGNRSQSVAALAQILPRLTAKGYRFESLPGC
ncbi:MAG TPA: polysaccharide deacetylase family protein, partial [Ornithinibacter sp.]|nr:polysaccharide deacetylase family protein [Ornithinibacter sp.]